MSKPFTVASMVGSCGSRAEGCLVVTASALSALPLTWGRPVSTSTNIMETRPAITSVRAGGELL